MSEEYSEDEVKAMLEAFKEMGVKPKAHTKEEFQKWMLEFAKTEKTQQGAEAAAHSDGKEKHPTYYQPPRLPNFSGDKKGDVTFDLWKYQVECLMKEKNSESVIGRAIRNSTKGEAARVIMRLGPDATVPDIIYKLESIFGKIDTKSSVLAEFFSAKQRDDEDVASWGCRLEDLMNRAIQLNEVKPSRANAMLRNMFYEGIQPTLQDTTGHIFDKIMDFDELRRAIRRKEEEINKRKATASGYVKSVKATEAQSNLEELKAMVQKLSQDVTQMKKDMQGGKPTTGHSVHDTTPQQPYHRDGGYRGGGYRGRGNRPYRGQGRGYYGQQQQRQEADYTTQYEEPQRDQGDSNDPICFRCGQEGHLAIGCRVRLDHMRRPPLNSRRPLSRRGR